VDDVAPRIVLSRDPKDSPYLDLAIGVGADYLVTRDKDLLTLGTDDSAEAREFRRLLPGCRIVEPVDFLRYMNESRPA
jgi:predicted nucleic acid-binding protein